MRSIQSIFDVDLNRHISADTFFGGGSWKVSAFRRKETARFQNGNSAYRCSLCNKAVVARKGGFNGTDHFAHRAEESQSCPWHTSRGHRPDFISAGKFEGRQESDLHKRLKEFIADQLAFDPCFKDIRVEKSAVAGDRHSTQPDVFAAFGERKIAFELQLSTTQVPIIEKREKYNSEHEIFTIWIFHDFTKFRELATSQDIYVTNFFNAFELDGDSIAQSKNTGKLHFRVWSREPNPVVSRDEQKWKSELVNIHDFHWHDRAMKAYAFDYLYEEAQALRAEYIEFVEKFESFWLQRKESKGTFEYKIKQRAFERFSEVLGNLWDFSMEEIEEWRFFDLLDRLYEVRDNHVIFGDQNLKGRVDTVLESWPWFTDILIAIANAYDCQEILDWETFQRKVSKIQGQEIKGVQKFQQIHAFNPALRFLFPEAAMALYQDI